eukprot:363955-Chlamydomonas_euryale.AAC.7
MALCRRHRGEQHAAGKVGRRRRHVDLPARVAAKDLDLVDCLIGAGVAQLSRGRGGDRKWGCERLGRFEVGER